MIKSKILLINLLILFAYMAIITVVFDAAVLVISILPIAIHIFINLGLFIAFIRKEKNLAYTYLLSAVLILLIGFPSCWGLSSISGGI